MDMPTQLIAQSYDSVPYDSKPFAQTHPSRLSARATLFGLSPPDVATARVLELGCASGGNLIPMAAALPDATFVGVDLSGAQIAAGHARIAGLGLTNIELRQQSIADIGAEHGTFDYIVCHGVYSWVPAPVRDAILRVAHDNLSDNGVAYISYNVFPGWRLRGTLRDAMLYHIGGESDPARKIKLAREVLTQLSEITDAAAAYGQMFRNEARGLAGLSDDYIYHEFLELNNEPCYVTDFLTSARKAGLELLTEASINITIAESFGPETGKILRDLSGNQLDRMEQYIDFVTGRTFRQTLLVRNSQASRIQRQLSPQRLDELSIMANLAPPPAGSDAPWVLRDPAGRTLTTSQNLVRDALSHLGANFPRPMTLQQLMVHAAGSSSSPTADADMDLLRDAVFKMVLIGMAEISSHLDRVAEVATSDTPTATLLSRADAAAARSWTTNPQHEIVPLSVVASALLPSLDGHHDRHALERKLAVYVGDGRILLQRDGQRLTEAEELDGAIADHVTSALAQLSKAGLLA